MQFRQERRGLTKLEYFLISVLIVVVVWAAWLVSEPLIRPAFEQFWQSALQTGTVTPTP